MPVRSSVRRIGPPSWKSSTRTHCVSQELKKTLSSHRWPYLVIMWPALGSYSLPHVTHWVTKMKHASYVRTAASTLLFARRLCFTRHHSNAHSAHGHKRLLRGGRVCLLFIAPANNNTQLSGNRIRGSLTRISTAQGAQEEQSRQVELYRGLMTRSLFKSSEGGPFFLSNISFIRNIKLADVTRKRNGISVSNPDFPWKLSTLDQAILIPIWQILQSLLY